MRIGATVDHRGIYTVRFIEKGQTYDITDLKEEDLRQTLEVLNTMLGAPMNHVKEKLQPQRQDGVSTIRGHYGACPWADEGVQGPP